MTARSCKIHPHLVIPPAKHKHYCALFSSKTWSGLLMSATKNKNPDWIRWEGALPVCHGSQVGTRLWLQAILQGSHNHLHSRQQKNHQARDSFLLVDDGFCEKNFIKRHCWDHSFVARRAISSLILHCDSRPSTTLQFHYAPAHFSFRKWMHKNCFI